MELVDVEGAPSGWRLKVEGPESKLTLLDPRGRVVSTKTLNDRLRLAAAGWKISCSKANAEQETLLRGLLPVEMPRVREFLLSMPRDKEQWLELEELAAYLPDDDLRNEILITSKSVRWETRDSEDEDVGPLPDNRITGFSSDGIVPRPALNRSVVKILTRNPQAEEGSGSGFVVGDGLIVTNRHVAEVGGLRVRRYTSDTEYEEFEARVESVHPSKDMALLKVVAPLGSFDALSFADGPLNAVSADQQRIAAGFPGDGPSLLPYHSHFKISPVSPRPPEQVRIRWAQTRSYLRTQDLTPFQAQVYKGNSGGPLLQLGADGGARVAGLVVGGGVDQRLMVYSGDQVRDWLQSQGIALRAASP